jgi:hypothetical protein
MARGTARVDGSVAEAVTAEMDFGSVPAGARG